MNALRDLSNDDPNLKFRIALRTDVYYLFRTSDESTDKIESSIIRLQWSNQDILVMLAKRVAYYFGEQISEKDLEKLNQREIASRFDPVIESRFQGSGHWSGAPMHRVLLSLTRKRPRDLIKIFHGAARNAYRNDNTKILTADVENTFSSYSGERIQDIILEFRSELPNIRRLVENMRPTKRDLRENEKPFLYTKDRLIVKLKELVKNQSIHLKNQTTTSAQDVAEFLYKIDFIIARGLDDNSRPYWVYFDQNQMLQSQFVDFGFRWEVHPAYRWALQPDSVKKVLNDIENLDVRKS